MVADVTTPAAAKPASRLGYRYVLWMLFFIYMLNFLDRQVFNIVGEDMKHDLKLSDGQLGLMTGLVFAIFYTVLGIPAARIAERTNRVWVIAGALAVWSAFTILCGTAQNYGQLLLARIGVGVGEAGCSPPAHSLITQTVPREKRAGAFAFYATAVPIGSMLSFAFGGLLVGPLGWRGTMWAAGLPGLILAVIFVLTVKDPSKGGISHAPPPPADEVSPSFLATVKLLGAKPAFWWMGAGGAFTAFVAYTQGNFVASFFRRSHLPALEAMEQQIADATGVHLGVPGLLGPALGVIAAITGIIGTWFGGFVVDKARIGDARIYCGVPAAAALLIIPFTWAFLHVDNVWIALLLLAAPLGLKTVWHGSVYSTAQSVVPARCRATTAAILLFIVNMIGLGGGPLAVGWLSDVFAGGLLEPQGLSVDICKEAGTAVAACAPAIATGLSRSMMVWSFGGVASAFCFWMGSRTLKADLVD